MSDTKPVSAAIFLTARSANGRRKADAGLPAKEAFLKDMQTFTVRQNILVTMEGLKPGEAKAIKMSDEKDYSKWLAHAHAIVRRYLGWGRYAVRYKLMQDDQGHWFCIYRKPLDKSRGKETAAA